MALRWSSSGSPGVLRAMLAVLVAAHLAWLLWRFTHGELLATEDDSYRLYRAYLANHGDPTVFNPLWVPGQIFVLALFARLGVPLAWTGIVTGLAAWIATLLAIVKIAPRVARRAIAPEMIWIVALGTPLFAHIAPSALSEPLALALWSWSLAGALERLDGGSRWSLVYASVALSASTWVRFESWWFAFAFAASMPLVSFRRGVARRDVAIDAAIAATVLIGPVCWLVGEHLHFHDAWVFLKTNREISAQSFGAPSIARVGLHRCTDLAVEAGLAMLASIAVLARKGETRARTIVAIAAVPLVIDVARGFEATVFPPRLVAPLALAFVVVAPGAIASVSRGVLVSMSVASALLFPVGTPAMMDTASVRFARSLRAGQFDAALGDDGVLVVERSARRPPFGWASVAVLWGQWRRVIFATREGARWRMVAPADVHTRQYVDDAALPGWLTAHRVRAAWLVDEPAQRAFVSSWSDRAEVMIDGGMFVARATHHRDAP